MGQDYIPQARPESRDVKKLVEHSVANAVAESPTETTHFLGTVFDTSSKHVIAKCTARTSDGAESVMYLAEGDLERMAKGEKNQYGPSLAPEDAKEALDRVHGGHVTLGRVTLGDPNKHSAARSTTRPLTPKW